MPSLNAEETEKWRRGEGEKEGGSTKSGLDTDDMIDPSGTIPRTVLRVLPILPRNLRPLQNLRVKRSRHPPPRSSPMVGGRVHGPLFIKSGPCTRPPTIGDDLGGGCLLRLTRRFWRGRRFLGRIGRTRRTVRGIVPDGSIISSVSSPLFVLPPSFSPSPRLHFSVSSALSEGNFSPRRGD